MSDYTICALCASDECEHALEPEGCSLTRWEVEVERVKHYRFGVLAYSVEEARVAARAAVNETWTPDDEDEGAYVRRGR